VSFLVLVRRVFIVDVNMLRAFVVTILLDYIKSRLVIRSKIEQAEVVTNISKLAE
jgi:hypothetical protein